jgi:long-chain acyl-CoA synthetase
MTGRTTLPRLLHHNATRLGDRPAVREKRGGIWQVLSWSDYAAMVADFAAGLAAHGFGRGDRLAVLGDNRPRLYAAMLAAQSLGGAGVPLWPDAEPERIAEVLDHAGVSIAVAEDAEHAERIIAVKARLPKLRLLVQARSHGGRQVERDWLKSFETVANAGTGATDQSEPADPALLLYNADTDREIRAVMLSHTDLLTAAQRLVGGEDVRQTDQTLAWLPMAWLGDAVSSLALWLSAGFTCNCPETAETARRDLREIGPTILIAPPGIWENMLTDIETRAAQASGLKRGLFAGFKTIAERAGRHREAGEAVPFLLQLKLTLGEALIFAPMRDQIGLSRLRWASTGGEPLTPHLVSGLRALGINLSQSSDIALARGAWKPAHA